MLYRLGIMGTVLLLSTAVGVSLGHATVAGMQIRPHPSDDGMTSGDRAYDRGFHWAKVHHVMRTDDCPQPDDYFLSGCVSATSSNG